MRPHITITPSKKPIASRFFARQLPKLLGLSCTVLLGLSMPLMAKEPVEGLTLGQAVERSLKSHPTLATYQYRLNSASAYAQHAGIGEKPVLNLTLEDAFGNGEHAALDNAQSTLSISWVLQGGLLEQRVNSAQSQINAIEIERDIERYDVAAQTAHAFLTVLALQERLKIAINAQRHAGQILNEIQKRVDAGRSPSADKLQAEVNAERQELEVEDIQHELKSAKKVLASQWGDKDAEIASVSGSFDLQRTIVNYDTLEKGIRNNPEIQYFLTQQRVLASEITLAREEVKNRWRFNAGVRRYEATEDYGLTLGVSLPLGKSTRNKHQIAALGAEQARYLSDARAKEIQLSTQLYVLYQELQHSYHINEALTQRILPRLERALAETQKAYTLGKYSYREWYALQSEVLDTRMELIGVRLKAHANLTEIERLTGLSLAQPLSTQSANKTLTKEFEKSELESNGDHQ